MVPSHSGKYTMLRKHPPFLIAFFLFAMVSFTHSFHLFLRIPFLTNFIF